MSYMPPRIIHPDARPLGVTKLRLGVFAVALVTLVVAIFLSSWIAAVPALVAMFWASAGWGRGGDGGQVVE
jgi:hypothetical protein